MVKIGIPLRYSHLEDGRCILYLGENTRRVMQNAGAFILPIVQVQDVDHYNTKYNELYTTYDGNYIAVKSKKSNDLEYISIMPTSFSLEDNRIVKDPKGLTSKTLAVRGVMVSTPKKNIYPILACLERLGVDVLDITLSSIGDYFEFKNKELDKNIGVVVNMGDKITTMSVFNKGVLTNTSVVLLGGQNIDNDISFIYKIPLKQSKKLKEEFALAHKNMAQASNIIEIDNQGEFYDLVQELLDNNCTSLHNGARYVVRTIELLSVFYEVFMYISFVVIVAIIRIYLKNRKY